MSNPPANPPPNLPTRFPSSRRAEGMLLAATFFWGWTFPVVKDAIAVMPVFAFLACRFALAALVMAGGGFLPRREVLKSGGVLGVLLFLLFAFQTLGLSYTSAANCAFITGLNVVWIALLTTRQPRIWLAVGLAVAGLWLMTAPDKGLNIGDGLTLLASCFIAWHIILLNRISADTSSGQLAFVQFAVVALLSLIASLLTETAQLPERVDAGLIFALAITVFGATIFSFWAQTHYQRHTTAVRAALIFIMEPVFAAFFAIVFYDEILGSTAIAGAALVLCAMLITVGVSPRQKPLSLSG